MLSCKTDMLDQMEMMILIMDPFQTRNQENISDTLFWTGAAAAYEAAWSW